MKLTRLHKIRTHDTFDFSHETKDQIMRTACLVVYTYTGTNSVNQCAASGPMWRQNFPRDREYELVKDPTQSVFCLRTWLLLGIETFDFFFIYIFFFNFYLFKIKNYSRIMNFGSLIYIQKYLCLT